jgi:hypothetical protein
LLDQLPLSLSRFAIHANLDVTIVSLHSLSTLIAMIRNLSIQIAVVVELVLFLGLVH